MYVFLYNMLRDLLLENDKLQQIVHKITPVSCKNITDLSSQPLKIHSSIKTVHVKM